MTAEPRLSVVLPVHNGARYLEESVRSLLAQTFTDFELLIGDDGSTDGTGDLVRRLAGEDSRIRLVFRPRKSGLSASANWLVSESRARFVAIAHADDVSRPDRLRREMGLIENRPDVVLVAALAEGVDPAGRVVQPPSLSRLLDNSPFAPFAHSLVLFRRSAFEQVGGYRSHADYWEDRDLYWRLARVGRILVLPDVLGAYRHSPASVRSRDEAGRLERGLDRGYQSAALFRARRDYEHLLCDDDNDRRVHPRAFVARSWLPLWSGERPGLLRRMIRHADLRFDFSTLQALAFVTWADVSPRSLRLLVKTVKRARNRWARRRLEGAVAVEWCPDGRPVEIERAGEAGGGTGRRPLVGP